MSHFDHLKVEQELADKTGFNPYYHQLESALDDPVRVEGKSFINLASNNYLGLANDKRIKDAMVSGIEDYGVSLCATPIASGFSKLFKEVLLRLAVFTGVQETLLFPSCYQANNGLFNAIVNQKDVVLIDQYAHSSLIEGVKASGCKIRPFLHNNLVSLEKNLQHSGAHPQRFVVTESVFSTEGSIAPFDAIVELCKKYDAIPVIDDSHGLGVIGGKGRGVLSHFNLNSYQGIYTASLGKAFANAGGIIGGPEKLMTYLKYYCSHYVYSTVISPAIVAGIEKTIDIIEEEFATRFKQLKANTQELHMRLKNKFMLAAAQSPIISLVSGSSEQTFRMAKYLFENNVLVTPFVYPSVPKNKGVIRMIPGANLELRTISRAIEIMNGYEV